MQNQSQYGETILVGDIQDASASKALKRIHFSAGSDGFQYDEAWLQKLIMVHPGLLPVGQIEKAFSEMVPVCMELPMRAGFADNLFVTPSGDIAVVECKLWKNPEARRQVIAQIIDYASEMKTWNYEALESAIKRAKTVDPGNATRTGSLYEIVSGAQEMDEAAFHDAVSRNLWRGRFLLLIVGDGIREGVETMTEFLQRHAGLHFTLSIVELALFELPTNGFIVQLRVLARTTNIDRGIVTLNDSRMEIVAQPTGLQNPPARTTTITQEHFAEELERNCPGVPQTLAQFLVELATYNVQPDYGTKTLNLRWYTDDSTGWNLATIVTSGEVWFDYHAGQARNLNRLEESKEYLTNIKAFVPGSQLKYTKSKTALNIAGPEGHALRIDVLLADETRRAGWLRAILLFQQAVAQSSEV